MDAKQNSKTVIRTHERDLQAGDADSAKQRLEVLVKSEFKRFLAEPLSESDTRSKIIDVILRDVMGWPETLIKREPHVRETGGYIDYLLSTSHPYFVVEAKRHDKRYSVPPHGIRNDEP